MNDVDSVAEARAVFNESVAPALAMSAGFGNAIEPGTRSKRFAYFATPDQFAIVAGPQEQREVDLALAHGLTHRGDRELVLILPNGYEFPTLQRAAWLRPDARPRVFVHEDDDVQPVDIPTPNDTIARLQDHLGGKAPQDELHAAITPVHLDAKGAAIFDLVEWATTHPRLDPGHRRGERAWHCMGQKVLSVKPTTNGLAVRGGIHTTKPDPPNPTLNIGTAEALTATELADLKREVENAIAARLTPDGAYHRADEHWLQAVIRRTPSLVGVEQPALREVPAWRPAASGPSKPPWTRGFVDVAGVDGHGDIRVVETKLAANTDDLLVFQGLDYYIWACAYGNALRARLGAAANARIVVHYVVGSTQPADTVHCSRFLHAQTAALTDSYPWRFQEVRGWHTGEAASRLLPEHQIPEY